MDHTRRNFIRQVGVGSLSATLLPLTTDAHGFKSASEDGGLPLQDDITSERVFNGPYTGIQLDRIAFPLGGLGAGMYCIEGTGAYSHMSIRHKPDINNDPGMFAAISIKNLAQSARIVEGPPPEWKKFGVALAGNGLGGTTLGLPHFEKASFELRFPYASIALSETKYPLEAKIKAWNPFIPTDEDNSSLPVAGLVYTFRNTGSERHDCLFSFHAKNFLKRDNEKPSNKVTAIPRGFVLRQEGIEDKKDAEAHFAITCDQENTIVDHCWFRGGWFDSMTMTWRSVEKAEARATEPVPVNAPGASLYVPFVLGPGEEKEIIVHTCWYVPYSDVRIGQDQSDDENCDPGSGCCNTSADIGNTIAGPETTKENYRPWYAARFKGIEDVVGYWEKSYRDLDARTAKFAEAFYSMTLPPEVIEAVAANLAILKSTTVLRQFDGRLWSFEGTGDAWGCCHGSCTHVWNYAQAIPHLFPALERTLRHTEFCENQNREGHQMFRASLPIRPIKHDFHAAADGQLGGIMKVYREWRISGDDAWLRKMYPLVKQSIDYCQQSWDPDKKGIIEEPHHNTYDIEFWGPDGMCTSFYVGALAAMVTMAKHLRKKKDVADYSALLKKGRQYMETELFNGEYFIQKIQTKGLRADPLETGKTSMVGQYSEEAQKLLEEEGPKYQYGNGCLSDGVLGSWIARMCGLDEPLDSKKIESHLLAVHRYNLRKDLRGHVNPQRPSFAFGNEGGLLLCSWPKGGQLSLPFVYSNEVWTGIEYQVAAHLMLMGKINEGLEIVRICRSRYDGKTRNPFDEYECGHWYARALASYGLIEGLTGVRYDAVDKTLYVNSRVGNFVSFLSTNTGFGTVHYENGTARLNVAYGQIPAEKLNIAGKVSAIKP